MKKTLVLLISALLALAFVFPALADGDTPAKDEPPAKPTPEKCRSAYLYCFENNTTLLEYNADETVYPTSTTKLMTGLVAFDHFEGRFDEKITVTAEMIATVVGNNIDLSVGEQVTVGDMMYALLVGGANDAANVLAVAARGSIADFVAEMNDKAQSSAVGATSTHYVNPTGMHDDAMVTTARDTAKVAMAFMKNETLASIVQTPKYVMEKTNVSDFRNIYNRNAAISKYYAAGYYDERAIGANAGGTGVGGYSAVEVYRDAETGAEYLAVVMGASDDEATGEIYSYKNAAAMMDWAFASYGYIDVLSVDKIVGEIPVDLSSAVDYVTLRPAETVSVFMPKSIDPETDLELHITTLLERLAAPVKAGDVVGTVTVTKDGEIVGTADLVTSSDVERSEFLYVLSQIETFTKSRFFIATAISAVVLTLVYVFGKAFIRGRRNRRI